MANPMFNMPETADPQLAAMASMAQMQQPGGPPPGPQMTPAGVMQAPGQQIAQASQAGQFMNPQNLAEMYGILAQGNAPGVAGEGYVRSMQSQQQLDQSDSPFEQYLRLYGNVNPYDFTTDSLSKFHNTLVETGDIGKAFQQLERVETLSTTEQGFLNTAINDYQAAERSTSKMMSLAQRFEQANVQGIRTGAPGRLEDWFIKFAGNEGDFQLLRQEFDQIRNMEVIGALPKGPASDKDIAIAQKGWPPATANAAYIAAFLRGMSKMKAIVQAQAMHRADFLSRERTEQGLLTDWMKDKDYWQMRAIDGVGGWYAPQHPDGTYMTTEEAMEARFGDPTTVGGAPTGQPAQQAGEAGADVQRSTQEMLEFYRQMREKKERERVGQ